MGKVSLSAHSHSFIHSFKTCQKIRGKNIQYKNIFNNILIYKLDYIIYKQPLYYIYYFRKWVPTSCRIYINICIKNFKFVLSIKLTIDHCWTLVEVPTIKYFKNSAEHSILSVSHHSLIGFIVNPKYFYTSHNNNNNIGKASFSQTKNQH